MIRLRGKTEEESINNKIIFEPRAGFNKGKVPVLEFPLIYGHRCPQCQNVIQAVFKAPRPIDLWPYEETTVLSQGEKNAGEVLKTFPDEHTRHGKTCYDIEFSPAQGGSVKLTLRNHIMRHQALHDRDNQKTAYRGDFLWVPGEKPCTKTGIFSIREDLAIKDFLLFSQISQYEIPKFNIPPIKDLIPEGDANFKLALAVGVAPPVILVDRQSLVYGFHYQTRPRMEKYRKTNKS